MVDGLLYQLRTVELDSVSILVVYVAPQGLKLLLCEIFFELILDDLGFVAVFHHSSEDAGIEYALDQAVNAIGNGCQRFGQRSKDAVFFVFPVIGSDIVIIVDVVVFKQVFVYVLGLLGIDNDRLLSDHDGLADEVFRCGFRRSVVEGFFDAVLQAADEGTVCLLGCCWI